MKRKYMLLGSNQLIRGIGKGIIEAGNDVVGLVSAMRGHGKTDWLDLGEWCKEHKVRHYGIASANNDLLPMLGGVDVMVVSWHEILGPDILKAVPLVIGTHPTELPLGRGNHPVQWQIVLGYPMGWLTLFRMTEQIDRGEIITRQPYAINGSKIADVMNYIEGAACVAGRSLNSAIDSSRTEPNSGGTYWRKRTEHDCTLDPRMDVDMLTRIVNSFGRPFEGAILWTAIGKLRIDQCERIGDQNHLEHGRIVGASNWCIEMAAHGGVVRLWFRQRISDDSAAELQKSRDAHPPSFYLCEE